MTTFFILPYKTSLPGSTNLTASSFCNIPILTEICPKIILNRILNYNRLSKFNSFMFPLSQLSVNVNYNGGDIILWLYSTSEVSTVSSVGDSGRITTPKL